MQTAAKDTRMKIIWQSIITWNWTKKLLYWIILSAGTMSECVFLVASLWVTINKSVHSFVLIFLSEATTIHLSQLATVAYVGLPECILSLAIVTTLSHIRTFNYSDKKDWAALTWSVLYGLPTFIFLALSLYTIGCSLLSMSFELPPYMIVLRGLAGYSYGIIALLYSQLGVPQEKDRLAKKDETITKLGQDNTLSLATLRQEKDLIIAELQRKADEMIAKLRQEKDAIIAKLQQDNEFNLAKINQEKDFMIAQLSLENEQMQTKIDSQNGELEIQKELLAESKTAQTQLLNAVHKSTDEALQAYSEECNQWLKSGVKTVTLDEITHFTGHSKRKIDAAITKGLLQTASRNKELILMSSLMEWLKITPAPAPKGEKETTPLLHVVNG
jgi:hypothetical protein